MESKSNHSFLTSSKSFDDFFDDLGETESATSARLQKGKVQMIRLYHPDKQKARINDGSARYNNIKKYELKMAKLNNASTLLSDRKFRE